MSAALGADRFGDGLVADLLAGLRGKEVAWFWMHANHGLLELGKMSVASDLGAGIRTQTLALVRTMVPTKA
jgi:hypothetical protein